MDAGGRAMHGAIAERREEREEREEREGTQRKILKYYSSYRLPLY